ncbi:MAG: GNAT family N-acetyltransferase [Leptolyngbya sp. IPPAS B-1204]|nr:MAG: GNAT family N-acetyltransferase [Leptolyngbya sp. IPPAS B-1204]
MQLRQFDNIKAFHSIVQDYLLQSEAEHNLMLGILHTLLHYPERYPELPYLAVVETSGKILAVAIRTPPYKLVLSKALNLAAIQLIAQNLQDLGESLPGVSGLVAEVAVFLQAWQALTGQSYRRVMEMRIHQLTQVESVATAGGHLRLATEADRSLLVEWCTAFASEIGEVVIDVPEKMVDAGLKRQSIYLWDDGMPVSWASGSQSLPTAARIGPVYTPPQYRRKGYATACVAALSQKLLDQGCEHCFLFTDLANPTSNHIYQQIGYRPVCDWHDFAFPSEM